MKALYSALTFSTLATFVAISPISRAEEHVHHLPTTTGQQVPFKDFKGSDITFGYPSAWKEKKTKEDEIVKLAGDITNGASAEMTLSKNKSKELAPEELKSLVQIHLKKLPEFKVIQEKRISLGRSRNITGLLQDVSFKMNGIPIFERLVYFEGPDEATYAVTFLTPQGFMKATTPTFNRILLSMHLGNYSRSTITSKKETELLKAKHAPITFSYPSGWEVKEQTGDKAFEIKGKNQDGTSATISLHKGKMHPHWTIENVADMLEAEHLKPQTQYRRLNSTPKTFGGSSNISGIVQENNFVTEGTPVRQLVAYFNDNKNAYVLTMTSTDMKLSEMRQTFHKVLASLRLNN